eukprot:197248_1
MNELVNLSLNAKYKKHFDIESFMNQKCINMKNIKSLTIRKLGDTGRGNRFEVDKFYQLLSIFSAVECIHLCDVFLGVTSAEAGLHASKVKQLCPNVNGLSVIAGRA